MSPKEVSEILFQIFSDKGYSVKGFKIKSDSPLTANIFSDGVETSIKFGNNFPKAEITKLITLYVYIEELVFGKEGGIARLKNFPDIRFGYDQSLLSLFFEQHFTQHKDIEEEIEKKYGSDSQKKKIAQKCLHYGDEWATIVSRSGGFAESSKQSRQAAKRQCLDFVVENVKKDMEKEYGSVILTYLLVFIVIPAIARFIIVRLLEKYF